MSEILEGMAYGLCGLLIMVVVTNAFLPLARARDTYATDPRYVPCHSPSGYCLKDDQVRPRVDQVNPENPCGPQ